MFTSPCKYRGRRVGNNQRSSATNHVYKHVRVLRRGIDALASLTDSELLTLYPELRHVATSVTALRQQRLKRIREKTS